VPPRPTTASTRPVWFLPKDYLTTNPERGLRKGLSSSPEAVNGRVLRGRSAKMRKRLSRLCPLLFREKQETSSSSRPAALGKTLFTLTGLPVRRVCQRLLPSTSTFRWPNTGVERHFRYLTFLYGSHLPDEAFFPGDRVGPEGLNGLLPTARKEFRNAMHSLGQHHPLLTKTNHRLFLRPDRTLTTGMKRGRRTANKSDRPPC